MPDTYQAYRGQQLWVLLLLPISTFYSISKNLPAKQDMRVQSLGWADPLEKEMATHFSILAWRSSWTEEPGGLQSMGLQRVGHDLATETPLL